MANQSALLRPISAALLAAALLAAACAWADEPVPQKAATPPKIDFSRQIKPILSNNCFRCHGPDPGERKGGTDGLRLDNAEGAKADLGGYAAIVPGKPEESALIKRITADDPDERMPPADSGKKLSPTDVELLTQWVREGGEYSQHWSYRKVVPPAPPAVQNEAWVRSPIDRFVLGRLERAGLKPAAEADRDALARRVSLDLIGLPPALEEVDAFVADTDPQAYEKLVDRLLAKPGYGEHWAQAWLDMARYADSAGYADDPPRTIWLYRDYVVRSFNANKPLDQFTIEQIAGDLLPNPTEDQLIATAFHRNTQTNSEGGTDDEEFRNVAVVDRVNTTMAIWMGTTIACAQCHNHKFDPITQQEYFRLFAILNETQDADKRDEVPLLDVYTDEQKAERRELEGQIAGVQEKLRGRSVELAPDRERWIESVPLDVAWQVLVPKAAKSWVGKETTIAADGSVSVAAGAKNDTYDVELAPPAQTFSTLQLEALADDKLPGKGPGYGAGNFVVTRFSARLLPPEGQAPVGRFVRIELPGQGKMVSLAEVQVMHGVENAAQTGTATQSSTDFGGPPELALDGNTNGDYHAAKSTTHTKVSDNPWWEVDLKVDVPIERILVWNRTDNNLGGRLTRAEVIVLDAERKPIWRQTLAEPPGVLTQLWLVPGREIEFAKAEADFSHPSFPAAQVLNPPGTAGSNGWGIAGGQGRSHTLGLVPKAPVEIPAGWRLSVTIEHNSASTNHTLGRLRLSTSDDPRAMRTAVVPQAVMEALRLPADKRTPQQTAAIESHFQSITPALSELRGQIAILTQKIAALKPETVPIMRELPADKQRVTKIQRRGNFLDVGEEVIGGTPAIFPPLPSGEPVSRLALAHWLVDADNPLTARVIVNRYWEQVFGVGIVATSDDFGSQGEQPQDPELLDYLAGQLVAGHWDAKALLRQLVTSATYRQASQVTAEQYEHDPDNRLLARGPRFRLTAEVVRDQALAVAGLLSGKMYGPPVRPYQPEMGLNKAFGGAVDWKTSEGEDKYRRGLYTVLTRSNPYPSMAAFDAPSRELCTLRRTRTNTPLQALVTLNDPVYVEAAQALARRMIKAGANPEDCARLGFRLCVARPPSELELARLVELYERSRGRFVTNVDAATHLATEPLGPAPADTSVTQLAAWTVVANVLLNLDEMMMKR